MEQQVLSPRSHSVDSGYAWVICFSAGVWGFFSSGLVTVLGVCFPQIEEQLQISASVVGLCSGIGMGLRFNLGPIWRALSRVFSPRQLMMAGGFISCVGLVMMSFAQSVLHLALSMVCLSLGCGIPSIARMVAMKTYFDKKFNTANSWSYMGGSIGLLVLPPLAEYLEEMFGWRGAILIYGAINLHICVAGALMVMPSEKHEEKTTDAIVDSKEKIILPASAADTNETRTSTKFLNSLNGFFASFGFSVLKKHGFLSIYLLAIILHDFVTTGWSLFFVSYVLSRGFTLETASLFQVASGLGTLTGRLVFGHLSARFSASKLFFLLATGGGISLSCYPFCETYWALMGNSFVAGMGIGSVLPLYMVLMKELFPNGSKDFASSVGLQLLARGVGQLLGGWIYDMSHSFQICFSVLAVLEAVTASLTISKIPLNGCRKRFTKRRRDSDELSQQHCNHTNLSDCNCNLTIDYKTNSDVCVVTNVNESSNLKRRVTKPPSQYMYVNSAYENDSENTKPSKHPPRRKSHIQSPSKYFNSHMIDYEKTEHGFDNNKSLTRHIRKVSAPGKYFNSSHTNDSENSQPSRRPIRKTSAIQPPSQYFNYSHKHDSESIKPSNRPTRKISAPSKYLNSATKNDSGNTKPSSTRPLRRVSAIQPPSKYFNSANEKNEHGSENSKLLSSRIRKMSAPSKYLNSATKNDSGNTKPSSTRPLRRVSAIQPPSKYFNSANEKNEHGSENSKLLSSRIRKISAPSKYFNSAYKKHDNESENSKPLSRPIRRVSAIQPPSQYFNTAYECDVDNSDSARCTSQTVSILME